MFFPIGDDNVQGGHKPLLAYSLIVVNTLVFIYEFSLGQEAGQSFVFQFWLRPEYL